MKKDDNKLSFALPDDHLMTHVLPFIKRAGIGFEGTDWPAEHKIPYRTHCDEDTDSQRKGTENGSPRT